MPSYSSAGQHAMHEDRLVHRLPVVAVISTTTHLFGAIRDVDQHVPCTILLQHHTLGRLRWMQKAEGIINQQWRRL